MKAIHILGEQNWLDKLASVARSLDGATHTAELQVRGGLVFTRRR